MFNEQIDKDRFNELLTGIRLDILDEVNGRLKGWTCGFKEIDKRVGRLEPGQVWTVGGYTGTGKSFFVLNMIEGVLREWSDNTRKDYRPPKMSVFSTELSTEQYIMRHVFLRAGVWKKSYINNPWQYEKQVNEAFDNYTDLMNLNWGCLKIHGNIRDFKQIADILEQEEPNIIFVDWIQDLNIKGMVDVKDKMAQLANAFVTLAQQKQIAVVLVSQVNNSAMSPKVDFDTDMLSPFSYGKEIVQISSTALVILREKEEGEFKNETIINILKARNGELGKARFYIAPGFKYLTPTNEN